MPDQVVPPMESPGSAEVRVVPADAPAPARRMSARMQTSARPKKPQDSSSKFAVPNGAASKAVSVGPASAPQLPPAERKPNRRAACSGRNKAAPRQARRRPTEKGRRSQHDREGRRKEPGKVFNPALHAHLVAQRPQDVVAAQHEEEAGERPQRRGDLAPVDPDDTVQRGVREVQRRLDELIIP